MATENIPAGIFAARLTELVRLSGRTQSDIAKEAQIRQGSLSRYMSGDRFPGWEEARRLAAVFHMPVELFLQGDAENVEGAPPAATVAEDSGEFVINWRLRAQHAEERLRRIRLALEERRDLFADILKKEFEAFDL